MSYFDLNTLNVGDVCGIYESNNYDGHWYRAVVVRVTKTTVTVEMTNLNASGQQSTFTKSTNNERGGRSWCRTQLVSIERYEEHLRCARMKKAVREQEGYRIRMLDKLSQAVRSDETFRALLAELNNHEYV